MRKNEPLVCLVYKEIRDNPLFVVFGFVVYGSDLDDAGAVMARFDAEFLDNGVDRVARVIDIVDNEDGLVGVGLVNSVFEGVHLDDLFLDADAFIGGCADRDVVRLDAFVGEDLLDRDARHRAAAPNADDHRGLKPRGDDLVGKADRVVQELLGSDEEFGRDHGVG